MVLDRVGNAYLRGNVCCVLAELARSGPQYAKWNAVAAIGEIGGPEAVKAGPSRERHLDARRAGADHTRIDFIGEIKDEFGSTVTNVRDKVDIKLFTVISAEYFKIFKTSEVNRSAKDYF